MLNAYIYDGVRSPFGRHGGCLSGKRPDDLIADVLKALMNRCDLPKDLIEDVILGNVCQSGEDSRNMARFAALLAGIPETTGAQTVNRLCGSSMSAALDATRAVTLGEGKLYLTGSVESMTRAPNQKTNDRLPIARIIAGAIAGVAPRTMGIGPASVIPKVLQRAGLTLNDMDVIEINEAFAAQVIACCSALKIAPDNSRLNPNGGHRAVRIMILLRS